MWIRKGQRDRLKGVDSPVPTQLVSNEEYIPRRQTQKQKEVEYWTGQIAAEKSRKLGMDRRKFMATPMGLAACFLASNKVWGKVWDVDEEEAADQGAYEEKLPKGE
ncbi:MAG: amidohydrolase, partial [Bryobacteraceae bacterium]